MNDNDNLVYHAHGDYYSGYTLDKYTGHDSNITFPSNYENKFHSIGENAIEFSPTLESIVIPEGLKL